MAEFRQFLTTEDFKKITMEVTSKFMKKREMAICLKFIATERSERGDL